MLALGFALLSHAQQSWVGTWAAAAEFTGKGDMPASPLTNRALREVVKVSVGADCLRLRLSNEFSKEPVEIKSVFIADALDSCDIVRKTACYLSFGGKRAVTIQPGECAVSDVCAYTLKPLQRLAVTINYGATPVNATSHRGSIAAIDVPRHGQECIAIIGNSITDGRGSTTNLQNRWPDIMANTLAAANGKEYGVLNLGIGGNCVVRGGLSEPALKRFDRDILSQEGVTAVVIYEGINDIGGSKGHSEQMAQELISAFQEMMAKAHDRGLKVYLATITPFGKCFYDDSFFKEAARQTVNQWIRTNKEADGFIDFDAAMRDPAIPSQLREDLQEDWLHPNARGYQVLGEYAAKFFLGL